jgi:hypothetical protein
MTNTKQRRIVLPRETGEQPSVSSCLSDAPWRNRKRPGCPYSIIEYERITDYFSPPPPSAAESRWKAERRTRTHSRYARSAAFWQRPGGSEKAQRYHPASLLSESGESLSPYRY